MPRPQNIIQKGYYLISQKVLLNKYIRWRKQSQVLNFSKAAKIRLEWLIYYETKARNNMLRLLAGILASPAKPSISGRIDLTTKTLDYWKIKTKLLKQQGKER